MTGEGIHEEERRKSLNIRNGRTVSDVVSSDLLKPGFLSNLTQLKLSGSGLAQLPVDLPPSDTIIEVDLSRNRLAEVPSSLCSLKNLRLLNLSGNELNKVPDALYEGLHVLKTIDLSGNRLVTFQRPPLCLPLLQNLDLSSNKLVSPPPWLLNDLPASLEFLDLSNNPCFQLLPHTYQQLPVSSSSNLLVKKVAEKVKTLRLKCCGLKGTINEKYVSNFKNVIKLDLGNTDLCYNANMNIMADLGALPDTVQELSLPNIGLACLPKCITSLLDLRKLDISKNEMHWLPPVVGDLKLLTVLRADSSKIYLLPPEMNLLSNLKELYLSNNELSSSDGFESLVSLEVLDLYQNQFITIPDFKSLSRLRALDFCQNFIDSPQLIIFEKEVVPYSTLCECFRSNYCQQNRLSGAKEFPVLPELDEERYSNFSDQHDFISDSELGLEEEAILCNSNEPNSKGDQEIWEIDTDDNYDPNDARCYSSPVPVEAEELTGQTSQEIRNHPHYFIPFRTASPTLPPNHLDPPSEGQFDD